MDPALGAAAYLRLRAPRESGEALLEPPLKHVGSLLAANRQKLAAPNTGWLAALAMEARPALLFAAANYTSQYRNVSHLFRGQVPGSSPTILLAGHQPQLFHAGVWFKNFVLSSLAQQHAAIGVNLIVDNDTMGSAAIRVPAGARSAPRTEFIPFDESSEVIPCEERNVLDSALFDSFGARVTTAVQSWLPQMVLQELWPLAIAARKRTANLGYALCEARHRMEGAWGLETLEVPLSVLYSQTSFHRFLLHLLLDLPRLHAVYNACLLAYRRVNHIRSKSHPVPDLAMEEEWLEAPLWIWSREQPRRRRLFVRRTARGLELTDQAKLQIRLSARSADDSSALEQLAALESRGIKLRPRALLTTMYARLVLSDLFLHGIGGAKYDELTDAIIQRYFEIDSPAYLTATATLTLPLDFPRVDRGELLATQQRLREIAFHPERFMGSNQQTLRKATMLSQPPPRGSRSAWHVELVRLNEELQPLLAQERCSSEEQFKDLQERYRLTRLLGSREFSFSLFPSDFIRALLLDLAKVKA